MKHTPKQIENCLFSELSEMVYEMECEELTMEYVFHHFRNFLIYSNVDSTIVVNVLEQFGKLGKEEALNIKITEGW